MELSANQAKNYLDEKGIKSASLINWIKSGLIDGWQDVSKRWYVDSVMLDQAISSGSIPPKIGKPRRYTEQDKTKMKRLRVSGKTLLSIAELFECDESYISLVINDKR